MFFLYARRIHCHKAASWETGTVIALFPGLLIFSEVLTITVLLWLISTSLRGIIPYHKTTLTFRLDSELCSPSEEVLGSEASRPQEEAEAVLTLLGSGSSLI